LDQLSAEVGRPASYLSQLENGRKEPRLSTINQLAAALGCPISDLFDSSPPNRRAELEVAFARIQEDPSYEALRLPHIRPSARIDDAILENLVVLFNWGRTLAATRRTQATEAVPGARSANAAMRREMRMRDNYFEEIEGAANDALGAVGYAGSGTVSERNLTDLAAHFGFAVSRVQDLPPATRSITDMSNRTIYVPQRNSAKTRAARSVIAQTLGHFALGHRDPADFEEYVRQRVESNYFAGALLAPEQAVVAMLGAAKNRQDIAVEDLNEAFYISYEMAAHRMTNLITRHFDIPVHFQRSDYDGVLWKAYENDGVPLPAADDGTIEGQRVCRWWSARQAFESEDSYSIHYQQTETPSGTFWCVTHIEVERDHDDAITIGTTEEYSRWFRGSDALHRSFSSCPEPTCCREPAPDVRDRWEGAAWPSARDHSHFVSGLPTDTIAFSPFPGVAMAEVYGFLDRHTK
jgi:predicted transcriptional regulator/DNA-binding XRE family transcriptional regulator